MERKPPHLLAVSSLALAGCLAAVGLVSAGLDPGWSWCTDQRAVPVIAVHGTADPVCLYHGGYSKLAGGTFPSVPGFYGELVSTKSVRIESDPIRGRFRCHALAICELRADDADVVLYAIKGEGHRWPGGKRVTAEWMLGGYNRSIDGTRQMWAFFREHPFVTT